MVQAQKISVTAVTGLIAVCLSGCGGSTCTVTWQAPNPFTGTMQELIATVDGASSDCCDAMKAVVQGETPTNPLACQDASLTEADAYNGGECSGSTCSSNGGFKTFYGLSDDCCNALALEPISVPDSCQQEDNFCVKTTIDMSSPQALCYTQCAQTMGCSCECFCSTCDAMCGNGCYDGCDHLNGCTSRCAFGEAEFAPGSVILSALHGNTRFFHSNQSSPMRMANVSQRAKAQVENIV